MASSHINDNPAECVDGHCVVLNQEAYERACLEDIGTENIENTENRGNADIYVCKLFYVRSTGLFLPWQGKFLAELSYSANRKVLGEL